MFATRTINTSITVLALALLVSCGRKEEPKTAVTPPTAAAAPQAPSAPAAQPPSVPAASPASAPSATSAVLATSDGEWPNVRLEIQELKRSSGTVMLRFTLINDANEELTLTEKLGGLTYGYNVSGVHLVDAGNKKKYLVVVDSEKKCLCSDGLEAIIKPKTRVNLWAKFSPPPDDVKKITVIVPHFVPVDDVPISG